MGRLYPGESEELSVQHISPSAFRLSRRPGDTTDQLQENGMITGEPLLLFDTCIHNGDTMRSIMDGFSSAGQKEILSGVVSGESMYPWCRVKPDLIISRTYGGCYPFERTLSFTKTPDSIYSVLSTDPNNVVWDAAADSAVCNIVATEL